MIEQQNRPWEITLVNLQEVLHRLDIFRKITGIRLEDIYNLMLAKGWTLGAAHGLTFMHGVIRLYHRATVRLLNVTGPKPNPTWWFPWFRISIARCSKASAPRPREPFVTILTDFADYPPHFWMERAGAIRHLRNPESLGPGPVDRATPRIASSRLLA